MKIKMLAMGLILSGALTMVGCGSSTEEAIDENTMIPEEQAVEDTEANEEYSEGDDFYVMIVDGIEKLFNEHDMKVNSITQFDGWGLDMGGNVGVNGQYVDGFDTSVDLALSDDLWYFDVELTNGWHTIVKYVVPSDTYIGCIVASREKWEPNYGAGGDYYPLSDHRMAEQLNTEYFDALRERIESME